jgi:long-chain acyl-CoA synthetase
LRRTYWAGWTDIVAANPVMRFLSRLGKILPVEPTRAARTGLALGAIVLKSGKNLVWFPEGGRSPTGDVQTFKPGIGMLIERFPTPTIPVFISGTREAWPIGRRFPRPHPVRVVIGQPLDLRVLEQRGDGAKAHEQIARVLQDRVTEMARGNR